MSVPKRLTCAIGVMAKAPQAGLSKTRLCPPLRSEEAAALSAAFLRDTTETISFAARSAAISAYAAYAPSGADILLTGVSLSEPPFSWQTVHRSRKRASTALADHCYMPSKECFPRDMSRPAF